MPQLASHHITQISELYPDLTDKNIEQLKMKLSKEKHLRIINLLFKLKLNNLETNKNDLLQIIHKIIYKQQDDDDSEFLPNQILARAKKINFENQKVLEQILQEKKSDNAFFWQLFIAREYPDPEFINKLNELIGAPQIEIPKENINPTQQVTSSTATVIQKKSSEKTTAESKDSTENEPVKIVSRKRKLSL